MSNNSTYYPSMLNEYELIVAIETLLQKYQKYADNALAQSQNPTSLQLNVCKHNNNYQCYLVDLKTKKKKYVPATNKTARIIAQSDYYRKLYKLLNRRIEIMKGFLSELKKNSPCTYQAILTPGRRKMITPSEIDCDISVEHWLEEEYEKKGFYSDDNIMMTHRGERVRSKSELLIANELCKHNIPYKYERPLMLDGIIYHPDFTILNSKSGREVIWEHFGLVDDPYYRDELLKKIRTYESNGFSLGINLFCTFETSRNQLTIADIISTIKKIID